MAERARLRVQSRDRAGTGPGGCGRATGRATGTAPGGRASPRGPCVAAGSGGQQQCVSQLEEPSVLSGMRDATWPHQVSPGPSAVPRVEQPQQM
nr:homeobox protein HMX1-like isoform X5 [Anser cygnoides]